MAGTALRHVNDLGLLALSCDSANVAEGAVLVPSTTNNDAAMLPTGGNYSGPILGLAYKAGDTSANRRIEIVTEGFYPGIASGAITRGQRVVVATNAGAVKAVTGTIPSTATIVGVAMESVNDGERVALMLGCGTAGGFDVPPLSNKVRCVATSNVTLASGLVAGQTIDGVTLVAGDRVLLASQSSAGTNGIYVATSAGTASYATDYVSGQVLPGQTFEVSEGTAWANSVWKVTATGTITVGTTDPALYPRLVKGTQALSSGTPSTATVSNLFVLATTSGLALVDQTAANAIKGVLTAGRGNGSLALTGPNTVTDSILYTIVNF